MSIKYNSLSMTGNDCVLRIYNTQLKPLYRTITTSPLHKHQAIPNRKIGHGGENQCLNIKFSRTFAHVTDNVIVGKFNTGHFLSDATKKRLDGFTQRFTVSWYCGRCHEYIERDDTS